MVYINWGKLLSLGIEDTFRTAATEMSLLAGSEEFNATKLFEVGKQPSQGVFSFRIGSDKQASQSTLHTSDRVAEKRPFLSNH